eukprot:jgi/Astpho2/1060/Aster-x0978
MMQGGSGTVGLAVLAVKVATDAAAASSELCSEFPAELQHQALSAFQPWLYADGCPLALDAKALVHLLPAEADIDAAQQLIADSGKDGASDLQTTYFVCAVMQALDNDLDGRICFRNYLRIYFPFAKEEEINTMHSWVHPEDAEGAARGPQLQPDQLAELRQLFAMYDLQHEGLIRRKHLEQAGLDGSEELSVLFQDAEAVTLDQFVSLLAPSYK